MKAYMKREEKRKQKNIAAGGEAVDPRQLKDAEKKKKPKLKKHERKIKFTRKKNPKVIDRLKLAKKFLPNVDVVIFPLFYKKTDENMKTKILEVCNEVSKYVTDAGLKSFIDNRKKKLPNAKYLQ